MELKEFLESKDFRVVQQGQNLVMNCPFCDDEKQRFGINNNQNHAHYGWWNCFNCFPAYAPITTRRGVIPISEIVVGDIVLTLEGNWKKVLHHQITGYKEKLYSLKIKRFGESFDVTGEHRVFAIPSNEVKFGRGTEKQNYTFGKPRELKVDELRVGDWLVMPKNKFSGGIQEINLELEKFQAKTGPKPKSIKQTVKLDYDFGFILGLYIAEGSYNRGINLSLNKSEGCVIETCNRIFKEKFNLIGRSYEQGGNENKSFWVGHTLLGQWFQEVCGHLSQNKKLPYFTFDAPIEFQNGLLDGIDCGDGKKGCNTKSITTTSKGLAYELRILLTSLGYASGMYKKRAELAERDGIFRKAFYKISYNKIAKRNYAGYVDDNFGYYQLKEINQIDYGGDVYDFTVEGEHTYTAFGFAVHNCETKGRSIKAFQKALSKLDGESLDKIEIKKTKNEPKHTEIDQQLALKYFNNREKKGRKAVSYLIEERGFSKETINHFMLGSWKKNDYEYVSIPFWEAGELVNIKFRAIQYKDKKYKWRRITGGKSSLFHDEVLDNNELTEVFVCEAELDAIALYNAGIQNVISVTTGAKGFAPEWYDRLERFEKIYIVLDNDVDGQEGAERLAKRLGMKRCWNIVLPQEDIVEGGKKTKVKDLNQYFWDKDNKKERHTLKDFKDLVKKSKQFSVKDVMSLTETLRQLIKDRFVENEEETVGFVTPWKKVNDILPRTKPGFFVVVTANPKVGKTTWVMNWFLSLAGPECPTYIECCEMRQLRVAEKCVAFAVPDFSNVDDMTEVQIREARFALPSDHVFLGYPQDGVLELEKVCEKITNVVHRYGVKMVCFDHLHFLVRGDRVQDKIGEVTRRFKLLAEQLGIGLVLIAQPRKVENNRAPTPSDLKDSSSIFQDLDTLVILHRRLKQEDNFDNSAGEGNNGKMESITELHVVSRWGEGGQTLLNFNGRKSKYYEEGMTYEKERQKFIEKRKGKGKSGKSK